jgi:hypothetical protein
MTVPHPALSKGEGGNVALIKILFKRLLIF